MIKRLYQIRFFYIIINHLYNFYITSKIFNPYIRGHKLKRLNRALDFFIDKILRGENFALVRNADGEYAIMNGKSVIAQEKWVSPPYISALGHSIYDSLDVVDTRYHYAISCPCCDKEAYYWYSSRIKSKNITFSNIWVNCNFRYFKKAFERIKRDAVLIANYRAKGAKIGNLNIIKHYAIDDDCIGFWENNAREMIDSIKRDFKDSRDLLFVLSAGPMSSPIIKELFLHNPNNTYVDFGSSIDSYYHTKDTRPYQDRHSIYGSRNCYIYEDFDCDVSVVLTLYKRGEVLGEQVNALLNQSIKPREIILFVDADSSNAQSTQQSTHESTSQSIYESNSHSTSPLTHKSTQHSIHKSIPQGLESAFDNIIRVDYNVGVWGRFAGGLLVKSKYVCFFDDDTIPAHRYLENCHYESLRRDGLYGGIGILSNDLAKYPFDLAHRTFGWNDNPPFALNNKKTIRVDFVGHAWFLKKDYLGAMWIGSNEFYRLNNVAEDAYLSFALKKYLNINTYVPPHKDRDFFSSIKGEAYSKDGQAISSSEPNLAKMNAALKILKHKYGMREVSFSPKWYAIYLGRKLARRIIKDEKKLVSLKANIKSRLK